MGIDRVLVSVMTVSPDLIQQLGSREDNPGVQGKVVKQVELLCRQIDILSLQGDPPSFRIDGKIPIPDNT